MPTRILIPIILVSWLLLDIFIVWFVHQATSKNDYTDDELKWSDELSKPGE